MRTSSGGAGPGRFPAGCSLVASRAFFLSLAPVPLFSERLDPALTRPGRIDREFQFVNAGLKQLVQLFLRFFEDDKYYEVRHDTKEAQRAALDKDANVFAEKFRGRTNYSLAEVQGTPRLLHRRPALFARPACLHARPVGTPGLFARPACLQARPVCKPGLFARPVCLHSRPVGTPALVLRAPLLPAAAQATS